MGLVNFPTFGGFVYGKSAGMGMNDPTDRKKNGEVFGQIFKCSGPKR